MGYEPIFDFTTIEMAVFSAITIIMYAVMVAAEWKVLTKAGEKGWKALIPFYNVYISHEIVGMHHFWFIGEVILWILEVVLVFVGKLPFAADLAITIITTTFTIVSYVIHVTRLCDCFGKGRAFKLGIILVPYVFDLILAFGPAEYRRCYGRETDEQASKDKG